jgi:hypothetical protein
MWRFFVILLIVIFSLFSCSGDNIYKKESSVEEISVSPMWGNKKQVTLFLEKEKVVKRGEVEAKIIVKSDVDLDIQKEDSSIWLCKWSLYNTKVYSKLNSLESKIEKVLGSCEYVFKLDSLGKFIELSNWKQIQKQGNMAINKLRTLAENDPELNPRILDLALKSYKKRFLNRNNMELFMMYEIQLYFSLSGFNIKRRDSIIEYETMQHPISGEDIVQTSSILLKNTYTDSTADISVVQNIGNSERLAQLVNSNIKEKNTNMQSIGYGIFNAKITKDYNVSFKTGLIQNLVCEKQIILNDRIQINRTKIRKQR